MYSPILVILGKLIAAFTLACSSSAISTPGSVEPDTPTPVAAISITPSTALEPTITPLPSTTAIPPVATVTPTPEAARTVESTVPTATPVPAASAPTPIGDASYGGVLNLSGRGSIVHRDVHQEISPALSTWGPGIVYSRLLRFKSGADVLLPSLAVECELCESWNMLDGNTFEFDLRDDVQWQDIQPLNGRLLTAEDVVYSYGRQRQDEWPNAPLLNAVGDVVAVARDKVRITLSIPDADFMIGLADGHSKIVAREAVEANGDLMNGPTVGTGPWILGQNQIEGAHRFERNPDYFEDGLPFLGSLNINVIEDDTTRQAAFRVRSLDVQQMEPNEWQEFRGRNPEAPFQMLAESANGVELSLKTTSPPFDNIDVRRAVFLAIDPWAAISDVWDDAAYVSLGVPTIDADWNLPDNEIREYFADPQVARTLLQGVQVPRPLPISIKVGDFGETYLSHGHRIADEMRTVGFDPTVEIVNRREFGEQVWLGGDYEMFVGPIAPITSPNGYLIPVLHSQGRWNTAEFYDAELDILIERQASEFDPLARKELVQEIQRKVYSNAYRFMPATRISIWTWWPRVQNFHPNFAGFEYSHWSRVWVR